MEPTPGSAPDEEPLYKFGTGSERLRAVLDSLLIILGAFFVAIVGIQIAVLIFSAFGIDPLSEGASWELVAVNSVAFVGFAVFGLGYIRWRDDHSLFNIQLPGVRDIGWTIVGLLGLFILVSISSYILTQLGVQSAQNAVIEDGRNNPQVFLYYMVMTILFVGPAEEFLFRGLIQGLFRRAYGVIPGVAVSAVAFGGVHYIALTGGGSRLSYIAVAAVLGVVLGILYEKTKNLTVPILVHGIYNAILFGIQYLIATGAIQTS